MSRKLYKRICRHCGANVEFYHSEKPDVCPECGISDFVKPETETKLFLLQKKWLEEKDKPSLGKMYVILCAYVKSKIKKILNGVVIYDEDKLEEKAVDSVNLLMEYYLTKEDFKIESSFMGYLTKQIKSTLYNKQTRLLDATESLNAIIDDSSKKELQDIIDVTPIYENSLNYDFIFDDHKENDLINGITNIVQEVHNQIVKNYSFTLGLLVLIGIHHYINRRPEEFREKFYTRFNNTKTKDFVEKAMVVILQFIKEN